MAVKQLPKISDLPEPPDRLVGDQERFDVLTFNSLKAQKKMVNDDLNKTLIPALNEFAVDVNASVDAAALSERNAHDSEEVAKRKAGEASGSAGAAKVSEDNAKVSETNALASKNAAALSAESAESDRIAAEAARDEAQDLANVGYASESHAGLAKVDGKTTQSDAGGVITVKDVAIEGDLGDLASARGQIGDYRTKLPAGTDLNDIISSGTYIVYSGNCTNVPMNGMDGYYVLRVFGDATNPNAAVQKIYSRMGTAGPEWSRRRISDGTWQPWQQLVQTNYIGDGVRVSRSKALPDGTGGLCILSVPEYEGATASAAGTSGLVPPATAGQQESFLTGGGEYKPALTKISDSVSLEDSTTAASATAVKAAYDRGTEALTVAEAALPKTGGDLSGQLTINGDSVARAGSNTKFNRTGYSSSPPLVWGGTHDDLINYNLYFTDQLRVYGANRAGSLCHSGNLDSAKTTTFIWDASIETSWIAAFNSDGSNLHPVSSGSLSVYTSASLQGCVARVNGQAIGLTGTWMVIFVGSDFNIKTSIIDGGSIPATENKNYVAIRIQ